MAEILARSCDVVLPTEVVDVDVFRSSVHHRLANLSNDMHFISCCL